MMDDYIKERAKRWRCMIREYGATYNSAFFKVFGAGECYFPPEELLDSWVEVFYAAQETMYDKGSCLVTVQDICKKVGNFDGESDKFKKMRVQSALTFLEAVHINVDKDVQCKRTPELVAHFRYKGSILPLKWAEVVEDGKSIKVSDFPFTQEPSVFIESNSSVLDELWGFNELKTLDRLGFETKAKFLENYEAIGHVFTLIEPTKREKEYYEKLKEMDSKQWGREKEK